MIKKLLTILLVVALCFGMVACDKDVPVDPVVPGPVTPADPDPVDPSGPDTPDVSDPSGPATPTGIIGVKRYIDIVGVFDEFGVPSGEVDADVLLDMLREESFYASRQAWEELVFSVLESTDGILEDPYVEFGGKPYWLASRTSGSVNTVQWTLKSMTCEAAEYTVIKDMEATGKLDIDIESLAFEVLVTNPEGFTVDVVMDISISTEIKYDAGRDEWFWDEAGPIHARVTVDGAEWPEFDTVPIDFSARYDKDIYEYGYTVSFDTKGGEPIDPLRFPGVVALDPDCLPDAVKENALFRGWELSPGDFIHDHENFLWPDCGETVNLTAVYWETPLPAKYETEANLTYRFLEMLSEIKCARKEQTKLQDLFDGSTEEKNLKLLDMFLLLIGEEDECGKYPYLKVGGDRYYGSKKDEGITGFTAAAKPETSDYRFDIGGTVTTNGGHESFKENVRSRSYVIGDASIQGAVTSYVGAGAFGELELDLPFATVDKTGVDRGSGYELSVIEGKIDFKNVLTGENHSRILYYDTAAGMGYYGDYLIIPDIWFRISRVPAKD